MATHSSILAWKIPWTEEPGGLLSRVAKSQTRVSDQLSFSSWNVMVLGSMAFGRVLGHEGKTFMNEINTFIKED